MNHKTLSKIIILVLMSSVLGGCMGSLRYAPRVVGFRPGYTDERMGENTYRVTIGEAWPNDWPDMEKFAFYRAAEITKSKEKKYFHIMSASSRTWSAPMPQVSQTTVSANSYATGQSITTTAVATTTTSPPTTVSGGYYYLDFRIIEETEIKNYKDVTDADLVIADLRYFIEKRK